MYIHTIPLLLLLWDFFERRPKLANNWKHSLIFYFLMGIPINLCTPTHYLDYSFMHKPVYSFIPYNHYSTLTLTVLSGALMVFVVHELTYSILNGFSRKLV